GALFLLISNCEVSTSMAEFSAFPGAAPATPSADKRMRGSSASKRKRGPCWPERNEVERAGTKRKRGEGQVQRPCFSGYSKRATEPAFGETLMGERSYSRVRTGKRERFRKPGIMPQNGRALPRSQPLSGRLGVANGARSSLFEGTP